VHGEDEVHQPEVVVLLDYDVLLPIVDDPSLEGGIRELDVVLEDGEVGGLLEVGLDEDGFAVGEDRDDGAREGVVDDLGEFGEDEFKLGDLGC
jgi:hypothetical protein